MDKFNEHGRIGDAALKSGMDRKTARKYITAGALPSAMRTPRDWRTREDPFAEVADEIVAFLRDDPAFEAKTIFEALCDRHPDRFEPGQLRTLQRWIRRWRAAEGPDKTVVFGQRHRPGEALQTDFTRVGELAVTIAGAPLLHLLCMVVLPFSNWYWATVCASESLAALRDGLQRALFQLGRVPQFHQTDNSTAATHRIPEGEAVRVGDRAFNAAYVALMQHFDLTPRTTDIGAKEQNGDVESLNGAGKRLLEQALKLRGHRDFDTLADWQRFVDDVFRRRNKRCAARLQEELAVMRPLTAARLPDFVETVVQVSEWSTLRVRECSYSVPSRLIGEGLKVRVYEGRIEAYFEGRLELSCERLQGRNQHRINYRHVIWSLVQKPGAFARYVYREEMFPTTVFRRAYDAIQAVRAGTRGDLEYLRVLHLAASTMETEVEAALVLLLDARRAITVDEVKALVTGSRPAPSVPDLAVPQVDLRAYDALLAEVGS